MLASVLENFDCDLIKACMQCMILAFLKTMIAEEKKKIKIVQKRSIIPLILQSLTQKHIKMKTLTS